jgi:hypothetical protein
MRRIVGREHEHGFRQVQLTRDDRHELGRHAPSVREDGKLVAAERPVREDVGQQVTGPGRQPATLTR